MQPEMFEEVVPVSVVRVPINQEVLDWAISRTNLDEDQLLAAFPRIEEWRTGETGPTLRQLKNLAAKAHVPLGRLLLDEPSGETVDLPDFRTVRNARTHGVSADLKETIEGATSRLNWYAEYLADEGVPPPVIVGSAHITDQVIHAAKAVRESLGLPVAVALPGQSKFRTLASAIEDCGVLVSKNSMAGNSHLRMLDVNEFRGFTILESGYALIFVNSHDSDSAQLFSLAHELGHVLLGQPGVSDHSDHGRVETWCNRFAIEFLAPISALLEAFDPKAELLHELSAFSRKFGPSREALLWHLVDHSLVASEDAHRVLGALRSATASGTKEKSPSRIPPAVLVRSRMGHRFVDTVSQAVNNYQLPERTAAKFLGVKTFDAFRKVVDSSMSGGREVLL